MNERETAALTAALQEWLGAASRLLRLLERQAGALKARRVEQVEALRPELEALFAQVEKLDATRKECGERLAAAVGTETKLGAICDRLPANQAAPLRALGVRVAQLVEQIQHSMIKNRALIENELVLVEGTIALVAEAAQQNTPFSAGPPPSVFVDQTA